MGYMMTMLTKTTMITPTIDLRFLTITGLACGLQLSAWGQGMDTGEDLAAETTTVSDASGADALGQDVLTGDWLGLRSELDDYGIVPFMTFTGDFLANVDGGLTEGSIWEGLIDFGAEVDFEPLLGLEGTSFFVNAFYFHGNDISNLVGDFNIVSNTFTDTDFNVFNLFLQQEALGGQLVVKAGQIAADDDFMVADTAMLFVNSAFGPSPVESGNIAAPIYPLAAPGVYIYGRPREDFYIQGAVYAGDAGPNQSNNHGFDWRTGGAAGWAWFAETGVHYHFAGEGNLKVGGFYATSLFSKYASPGAARGLGAVYGLVDHQFLDPEVDALGLSAFLRGSITPDTDVAVVASSVEGGVQANRLLFESDALGLGLVYTLFSDDYLNATRASGIPVTSSETVLELTYQVALAKWASLQPDLQYIIDPHFSGRNALVLGLRAELIF